MYNWYACMLAAVVAAAAAKRDVLVLYMTHFLCCTGCNIQYKAAKRTYFQTTWTETKRWSKMLYSINSTKNINSIIQPIWLSILTWELKKTQPHIIYQAIFFLDFPNSTRTFVGDWFIVGDMTHFNTISFIPICIALNEPT